MKTNCPQSELSGFQPTPETVQDWMDKLTANGITKGVLCRLIHGRDEGKIVKFENYGINDLGVYTEGGYFLHSDDVIKVAKPLYKPLLELSNDVGFFGGVANEKKFSCFRNSFTHKVTEVDSKGNGLTYKDTELSLRKGAQIYEFENAQDLFGWMGLND